MQKPSAAFSRRRAQFLWRLSPGIAAICRAAKKPATLCLKCSPVTVLGQNPYTMSETERAAFRRDCIGAVPKDGGFLPELTLLEQVRLPMVLAGLSGDEIRSRIRKNAFDYLPLHDLYNPAKRCTPRTLALASLLRASVMNPPILLLNASFEHLKGKDAELVWQEVKTILTENLAFLYLGKQPAA